MSQSQGYTTDGRVNSLHVPQHIEGLIICVQWRYIYLQYIRVEISFNIPVYTSALCVYSVYIHYMHDLYAEN